MVGAVAPDDLLIHHFSIGSRASRTAYALPGRMALVYHNITPPEYFIGVHKDLVKLCFRGRRELTAYIDRCDLALGDSEYNRAGARGARLPAHRRPAGRPRLHAPRRARRTACSAADFDDEWTNVMFVGRVIPNKKFEDVIRAFHAYRTRHNPRSRLLLVGSYSGFERYLAMLHALDRAARHAGRALPRPRLERGADGALRRRRSVPLRQRARGLLRAAHRGVLQAACRCSPTPPRPCPRRWTAAACCTTTKDPLDVARLMDAVLDDADARGRGRRVAGRRARRGCGRRTSAARCCASSTQMLAAPPRAGARGRLGFLGAVRAVRAARGAAAVPAGAVPGAAAAGRSVGSGSDHTPTTTSANRAEPIAHDHQPVGAGGAPGRRDRRQRPARARHAARRMGHESELFALTIDDDLRDDVRPFADRRRRGAATSRSSTSRCPRR